MKKLVPAIVLTLAATLAAPAFAGPATDALAACISDNSTGKDRKDLAQWIFATMSVHPEIKRLSTVTDETRTDLDKTLARISTRLLTESCAKEAKLAIATEGPASFEGAFRVLGELAMQELMTDASVKTAFTNYTKYLDKSKFQAIFAK